jgi:hypothetical protein
MRRSATGPSGTVDAVDETGPGLTLRLALASPEELDTLERALLRARAGERSEVRRRDIRLTAGYGDATNRDMMDDEARRAQQRYDALTAVLEALEAARVDRSRTPDVVGEP